MINLDCIGMLKMKKHQSDIGRYRDALCALAHGFYLAALVMQGGKLSLPCKCY